jgi:hypothetical protein
MGKTILVTGDVFLQENLLARSAGRADGALDPLNVVRSFGGACRLAELARAAIEKADVKVVGPTPPVDPCRAFVVWAPFAPEIGKKDEKDFVWRIQKHLGAQDCGAACPLTYPGADIGIPDVLLIEDLNLGFRDHERLWPAALEDIPATTSIVLRASAPLKASALWNHLFKCKDRLTVVVSADALRARGAGLTAPLSWDQTIEEIATEIEGARFANDLAQVKRVVVQFGADGAASFTRLQPLFGPPSETLMDRVVFERCLYDPSSLEGAWKARREGLSSDGTSILAAAMARHEAEATSYPLFIGLARGLTAVRRTHELGGGLASGPLDFSLDPIRETLHPVEPVPPDKKKEPEGVFYTAFPHSVLDHEKLSLQPASESDLLRDFTGSGLESVVSTGIDVVLRGVEKALKPVPKAVYGKYTTADREEIERLNAMRNLIVGYRDNPKDKRPLSFAVFGPPGSGKSFAVKQLMEEVMGKEAKSLEFNLSQMGSLSELHVAFHKVRDASIQNQIPFVFWDEFDTEQLKWLKDFLAPMQDAAFHAGGNQHLFGKAIFVFAGGVASSLRGFPDVPDFRSKKGPDFLSRLRGHIDVKGPNSEKGAAGHPHVIRRAILLRKQMEVNAPHLVDRKTKFLAMDPAVVRAFLTVASYEHGARSLEAIVTMSGLVQARSYGLAQLPTRDLLDMHVSPDFMAKTGETVLDLGEIESLAKATHEAYSCEPGGALSPYAVPFPTLPEAKQESNRAAVRAALVALNALGYRLVRCVSGTPEPVEWQQEEGKMLKRLEHDRWLREVLLSGWAWHQRSVRPVRLNENILPYSALSPEVEPLDIVAAKVLMEQLPRLGFSLVKAVAAAAVQP